MAAGLPPHGLTPLGATRRQVAQTAARPTALRRVRYTVA
jgi:hypothetical protein